MKARVLEALSRLLSVFRRHRLDEDFEEELSIHIEMLTEENQHRGMTPAEARRQAILRVGGLNATREIHRTARGIRLVEDFFWSSVLDFKLGTRMMKKYPGLTVVGLIGMGIAIAIGGAAYRVIDTIIDPVLPLDEGDRIVTIHNINPTLSDREDRKTHLHDLITWREAMDTIKEFGAYRTIQRNLITPGGRVEPMRIAEITASGFRIARVPPFVGRYFDDQDERAGSEPVVVIGYDIWQARFAGGADILGRTLQLGTTLHRVIGVMPRGFAFPVNNGLWIPMRLDPASFERGQAPAIEVFGRLAPGATMSEARVQAATIAQRLAAEYPTTHQHSSTRVIPYAHIYIERPESLWVFHLIQLFFSALLVVIGTNISILVYARTVTRMDEFAVRTALGASRTRVVAQLFVEALVLSGSAALLGLAAANAILKEVSVLLVQFGGAQVPFWWNFNINSATVEYAAVLAILGAAIVGVLPALKVTGRGVHAGLQSLGSGGVVRHLGRTWTVLIVGQVAIAVMLLPLAVGTAVEAFSKTTEFGFASSEFLLSSLQLDQEREGEFGTRYADVQSELIRRLEAEPGISGVTLTTDVPGSESYFPVEVEKDVGSKGSLDGTLGAGETYIGVSKVDLDYFGMFEIPILAGRGFGTGDLMPAATSVIVNRTFVEKVLGGGSVLGQRVRYTQKGQQPGPWYEIVGIVPDFPKPSKPNSSTSKLYHPMVPSDIHPIVLAVRVRGSEPSSFADHLREVTAAVDPMLRLGPVTTLDEISDEIWVRISAMILGLVTLSVILLSAAGIYALMSVTVEQRRREIGIRIALGADRRRILVTIFGRAAFRLGIGVFAGTLPIAVVDWTSNGEALGGHSALVFSCIAAIMITVGLIATVGPARRGLRICPAQALKENG